LSVLQPSPYRPLQSGGHWMAGLGATEKYKNIFSTAHNSPRRRPAHCLVTNFQAFLLSELQPSPYRPLQSGDHWMAGLGATEKSKNIFSTAHNSPGVVQPTA
jgi:hypothetical protein